jgi:hypothetical protein
MDSDPIWLMLQQVASRNKSLVVLQQELKLRFKALSKHHTPATSKFRQKRALSILKTIHSSTNGAVFIASVLAGYTVLATVPDNMDLFLLWYEAKKAEPFTLLAFDAYKDNTEEVNKLLKRAEMLGASEAPARTHAQLGSKQVLALGASAHTHTDTQPELPQDFNTLSTPPHTQPQIDPRQSLSTLYALVA